MNCPKCEKKVIAVRKYKDGSKFLVHKYYEKNGMPHMDGHYFKTEATGK